MVICAATSRHIAGASGRECSEQKTPCNLEKVSNGTFFDTITPAENFCRRNIILLK